MLIKYQYLLGPTLSLISLAGNATNEYSLPSFDFELNDRKISIRGCSHCSPLAEAIPEARDVVAEYSSLIIEHEISNTVLNFLDDIDADRITAPTRRDIDENNMRTLPKFIGIFQTKMPKLISKHDLDNEETHRVPFCYSDMLNWKPWIAHLLLQNEIALRVMGETGGVELALARQFRALGKPVEYLETPHEIFDILDENSTEFKSEDFSQLLVVASNETDYQFAKEICAKSIRINKESALFFRGKHPKSVTKRNMLWLEKIKAIAESDDPKHKTSLIIVGWGHLSGPFGLINLMKNDPILKKWHYKSQ